MNLVTKTVAEVVNFKAEAEETMTEEADAIEEEDMMAVVDAESDMEEAVVIIQAIDREYQMQ